MPKITITEKDYTAPGFGDYSNFAVLVPGFIDSDKATKFAKVADENNVYELSSKADFEENIGKVAPGTGTTSCVYAIPEVFEVADEDIIEPEDGEILDDDDYLKNAGILVNLNGKQFYATYVDQIYKVVSVIKDHIPMDGSLKLGKYYIPLAIDDNTTWYYKVEPLDDTDIENYSATNPELFYVVLLKGNEGLDEVEKSTIHYGNQIAYELLKMGYSILYKKLTNVSELDESNFYEGLTDKSNYDFRFIINGLLHDNVKANNIISELAEERGDCIALVDINEEAYLNENVNTPSKVIAAISNEANKLATSGDCGKYTAIFAPSLCYNMAEDAAYDNNTKFPAYFHYLACFNQVLKANYNEWFAAAGLYRGLSAYSVVSTEVKLGEVAEHALEPRYRVTFNYNGEKYELSRAVNIIEKIRGGYYLYGNRTAHKLIGTDPATGDLIASHFLNIRQLCTTLKKDLYKVCKRFTFDPNSHTLWINFCNAIRPTLETMKADQGIEDYEIIQVATSQKAKLCARIRIVPIEAVEDFDIELSLEDRLGETSVTISE